MVSKEKDKLTIWWLLSKKYKLPPQVIYVILNHPFVFMVDKIQNDEDLKDIYFPYFGKFKIKNSIRNKLNKQNEEPKSEDRD